MISTEDVRKAADSLRLIDEIDLRVIDGGVRTHLMAETIVTAVNDLKALLHL